MRPPVASTASRATLSGPSHFFLSILRLSLMQFLWSAESETAAIENILNSLGSWMPALSSGATRVPQKQHKVSFFPPMCRHGDASDLREQGRSMKLCKCSTYMNDAWIELSERNSSAGLIQTISPEVGRPSTVWSLTFQDRGVQSCRWVSRDYLELLGMSMR